MALHNGEREEVSRGLKKPETSKCKRAKNPLLDKSSVLEQLIKQHKYRWSKTVLYNNTEKVYIVYIYFLWGGGMFAADHISYILEDDK
jgi:hypothetical protein